MVLRQLTGWVVARGWDELGRYAWQAILLDGTQKLLMITAYRVPQDSLTGCGYETSAMQQWQKLGAQGNAVMQPIYIYLMIELKLQPHLFLHSLVILFILAIVY
jgi:hypothetical protein